MFTAHGAFVLRTLRHMGVAEADLEDVCQEVFVTVHRRFNTIKGGDDLVPWIYRIAWNTAANYRRKQHAARRRAPPPPSVPILEEAPQEAQLRTQRRRAQLLAMLDELSCRQRAVFVLYEIEQLSMHEVVRILGCPLQTGYSRLKSARATLVRAARARGWGEVTR